MGFTEISPKISMHLVASLRMKGWVTYCGACAQTAEDMRFAANSLVFWRKKNAKISCGVIESSFRAFRAAETGKKTFGLS